jgi:hypothetical protein
LSITGHGTLSLYAAFSAQKHLVKDFLAAHPKVRLHFTPTCSSWLNQVELWFSKIERDVIARDVFTSVPDLKRKFMRCIRHYNKAPRPWSGSTLIRPKESLPNQSLQATSFIGWPTTQALRGTHSPPSGQDSVRSLEYVRYRTDWIASKVHKNMASLQYGYTKMTTSEVVQPDVLAKYSRSLQKGAAQVGGAVESATLTLTGRVLRNGDRWRADERIDSRQTFQAVALDVRSSRYQRRHADIVRAAGNVLEWKQYLPADCVKAMIASGWHFTV